MMFYVAKGLQIAGLIGVGFALVVGLTNSDAIVQELVMAVVGMALFYTGRLIEPGSSG